MSSRRRAWFYIGLALGLLTCAVERAYGASPTVTCPVGWVKNVEQNSLATADVALCTRCFQPADPSSVSATWTGITPRAVMSGLTYGGPYSQAVCSGATLSVDATGNISAGSSSSTNGGALTSSINKDELFSAVGGANLALLASYSGLNKGTLEAQVNNSVALSGPTAWMADFIMGTAPDSEFQSMTANNAVTYGGASIAVNPGSWETIPNMERVPNIELVPQLTFAAETDTGPASAPTTGLTLALPSAYATPGNMTVLVVAVVDAGATPTPTPTATGTGTATATPSATPTANPLAPVIQPCTTFPLCVLVTLGTAPGVVVEQPPTPPLATPAENDKCCSVVRPPLVCDYHSATCIYVNP